MNEIIFLALFFLATFLLGRLLESVRIPWIFAALLVGVFLAIYNPFPQLTSNAPIDLLSGLGMYFLLFIIGFELDVRKFFKSSVFIVRTTFLVIFLETIVGGFIVFALFDISLHIALLIALSFATVGESVLLPILEEFKLVKSRVGQTMLSIGVLDDLIEVASIAIVVVLLGRQVGHSHFNIWINLLILCGLFVLAFVAVKFKRHLTHFNYKDIPSFFLFVIFFIFLFVGIGLYVESAALGALLAGIALRNIIPKDIILLVESEVKALAYGLFAPIYFMTVGLSVDFSSLLMSPWKMLLVIVGVTGAAMAGSFLSARKELGSRGAFVLGLGLSVKLSTSVVVLKLLLDSGMIGSEIYSVMISAMVVFLILVPLATAWSLGKWQKYLKVARS